MTHACHVAELSVAESQQAKRFGLKINLKRVFLDGSAQISTLISCVIHSGDHCNAGLSNFLSLGAYLSKRG